MRTLWIVSWYPSRLSPFSGDFIKRHAEAVSLYDEVDVLYVVRDEKGSVTRGERLEVLQDENLSETLLYYYLPRSYFSFLGKFISGIKYRRNYKKLISEYVRTKGKPALVHLHVSIKAAPLARWVKKKYQVDYIVTEHWTGFLPEARAEWTRFPYYIRQQCLDMIRHARAISAVSEYLSIQLKKISGRQNSTVIPNVVNTDLFFPAPAVNAGETRFVHISGLGYQKNPEDILRAFAIVKKERPRFYLDIFGPENQALIAMASRLGLQSHVSFHREVPQEELVKYVQGAHALLLYSRYETFGCVVIEANACGIPAIVSDVPVMHELVRPGFNGLIVEGEKPAALAHAILSFIDKKYSFDPKAIAEFTRQRYSYATVGLRFHNWYEQLKD